MIIIKLISCSSLVFGFLCIFFDYYFVGSILFLITAGRLFQTTEFFFVEMITLAEEGITEETNKHYGGTVFDYY